MPSRRAATAPSLRQETLALADGLMETVAYSSRIAIEDLLKQGRAGMTVRMAESELAFFRLPR